MATNANWTIVFEDKLIIKQSEDGAGQYVIDDDTFWGQSKFSNIWAIQSGTSNTSDEVEHRDSTPHCSLSDEGIDIQQFIDKWDAVHLLKLQSNWDINNDPDGETEDEKIIRLGERPTSYSS